MSREAGGGLIFVISIVGMISYGFNHIYTDVNLDNATGVPKLPDLTLPTGQRFALTLIKEDVHEYVRSLERLIGKTDSWLSRERLVTEIQEYKTVLAQLQNLEAEIKVLENYEGWDKNARIREVYARAEALQKQGAEVWM